MAFFKLVVTIGLFSLASADVSEIVGKNQYLPPSKGYNYDRPSIPFPSSPAARPTPSYQTPFPSRPTYQPPTPSYRPPAPSYVPPVSSPRPSVSRPLPSFQTRPTGYQPGAAPSGNQGTYVGPSSSGGGEHDHHHHHEPGMPYDFEYKVKDDYFGTDYYRNEVSDGDIIRGEYRVQLPDGRTQIVKYTADWKNGFNADVSYQGQPNFPSGPGGSQFGSGSSQFGSGSSQFGSGASKSPNAYIPPARY